MLTATAMEPVTDFKSALPWQVGLAGVWCYQPAEQAAADRNGGRLGDKEIRNLTQLIPSL